jgi:hypothetical protein
LPVAAFFGGVAAKICDFRQSLQKKTHGWHNSGRVLNQKLKIAGSGYKRKTPQELNKFVIHPMFNPLRG